MPSESEQPNSLEQLEALKRHQNELDRRLREFEDTKNRLEDHLISLDATNELRESANLAEVISNTNQFKRNFCNQYDKRVSALVDITELVIDILLLINLPALPIFIPALAIVKIWKLGVERYCK